MPRYLVERRFPEGLAMGVTWVHSYVAPTGR
jgi:hypothetical protein